MEQLTIGQVARAAGLKTSAIRYYESIGLIPEPKRVSGQRRYNDEAIEQLQAIKAAKQIGLSLDDIRFLLDDQPQKPGSRWKIISERKIPELDALITRAQTLRAILVKTDNCSCISIEDCFNTIQAYQQ